MLCFREVLLLKFIEVLNSDIIVYLFYKISFFLFNYYNYNFR